MKSFYFFNNRILSHVIFWLGILFIYTFFPYLYQGHFFEIFKTNLFFLPQDIIAVYFVLYVLFPRYLISFKIFPFLLFTLLTIVFLTTISAIVSHYILPNLDLYYSEASIKEQFANSLIILFSITSMAATIKYVRLNLIHQFQKKDILMKQMEIELKYLRSQLNPHFLFNSLNNIDELIFNDQEKASKAIFHLSEVLRYVLKESETNKVPLNKELEFIQNYIDFVRLSFKKNNFINVSIEGTLINKEIAPLLFLPVIENAVKYVDRKTKFTGINIKFIFNHESIEFICKNKFITITNKQNANGIGLKNLKRRLELLYPDNNKLSISNKENEYIVKLKIFEL